MEMFDYSRTERIDDNIHWMMKFFDKAKVERPVIGDKVTIGYTSYGDYFTYLDVNGIEVWYGKMSTP
jgi:hypothetical protein